MIRELLREMVGLQPSAAVAPNFARSGQPLIRHLPPSRLDGMVTAEMIGSMSQEYPAPGSAGLRRDGEIRER